MREGAGFSLAGFAAFLRFVVDQRPGPEQLLPEGQRSPWEHVRGAGCPPTTRQNFLGQQRAGELVTPFLRAREGVNVLKFICQAAKKLRMRTTLTVYACK